MPIHDWTKVFDGAFHDFHNDWIAMLKRVLNSDVLPPHYYAMAEQVAGGLRPDVLALEHVSDSSDASGGTAVATVPQVQYMFSTDLEYHAQRRYRVVVRHRSDDTVVSMIEIVSPGNKSSKGAIASFVHKSIELLEAGIHLLIVDLFPPGPRDPQGIHARIWDEIGDASFALPSGKPLTFVSYCTTGEKVNAYVQPASVGETLPEMPLFLKPDLHVDVPLDRSYDMALDGMPRRWREQLDA